MSSFSILFLFVAVVVLALLALNFLLAPRNPYFEKLSVFECGFHSFQQSREPFHLSFFMYAIVYLILDLEIVLLYPYAVSTYDNGIYGLVIMLIFTFIITIGFVYELSSGALQINSRQNSIVYSSSVKPGHLLHSSFTPIVKNSVPFRRSFCSLFSIFRCISTINSSTNFPKNKIGIRRFTTNNRFYSTSFLVVSEKTYVNANRDKLLILKEAKGKAGVYRLTNLKNGKSYIGSSVDLNRRFRDYFNFNYLHKYKYVINRALLKYGIANFSIEILEYCEPKNCIDREQNFLDLLRPEYNILKKAGSLLGYKHLEETKIKIKKKLKAKILTREEKAKVWTRERLLSHIERLKVLNASEAQKEFIKKLNLNPEYRAKRLEHLKKLHTNSELQKKRLEKLKIYYQSAEYKERLKSVSKSVKVFDTLTNAMTVYPSMAKAARSIGCEKMTISLAIKHKEQTGDNRLVNKRYLITIFNDELQEAGSFTSKTWKSNAHKVEVCDTENGDRITVYLSIREAARAIVCHDRTIANALKNLKEKGEHKPIKKRYLVKPIND